MTDNPSLRESIEAAMTENGVVEDANRVVMDDDASERDEHGRFKSKAKEDESSNTVIDSNTQVADKVPDAKASKVSQEAKPDEAKGNQPNADPTFEAPATWRTEAKAQWDKIPLPVKAEIAKRERENIVALNEANNKLASREKDSGDLDKIVAPYAQEWGQRGIRTSEAIAQTLARAKYAYSNPDKFIKEFAAETGVNLDFSQQQDPQNNELTSLRQELASLKQQVTQAPQEIARQQQAQAVHSFADEKDETGQPKRPYFEKVSDLMVNLMPRINATEPNLTHMQKLEKAYDMACRAHSDTWAQMQEDMFVKNSHDKVQKEVAIASAAKARAVSPASGSSSVNVDTRGQSLRETILAAMSSNGAI